MNNEQIAKVCHEANKAYCESIEDNSQKSWEEADQWQRDSAIKGVEFCKSNPEAPASANHDSWLEEKKRTGWKYGAIKNVEAKEHPCFVSYEELPKEQQTKDQLFKVIVSTLNK